MCKEGEGVRGMGYNENQYSGQWKGGREEMMSGRHSWKMANEDGTTQR